MSENLRSFVAANREAPGKLSSTIAIVTQPGWLRTFFFSIDDTCQPRTHIVPNGRRKSSSKDFRPSDHVRSSEAS
jgi:hypothetical protein